jgi:hypothetical protein
MRYMFVEGRLPTLSRWERERPARSATEEPRIRSHKESRRDVRAPWKGRPLTRCARA